MYTAFLRKYIPIKWPEQKSESHTHEEEEEEEDKPITITIKKEELATSIQKLLDTMNEEGKDAIDGIPLDHILEVLTAAREVLEEEMAHQTCPVSAADFAIKDVEKSEEKPVEEKPAEEEEWHVSGMKLPFAFIPEEKPAEPVEEKPAEPVEEKPEVVEEMSEEPEELKPVEPVEEKPVEEKPVEEKPVEEKPVEEKPVEEEPEPVEEKPKEIPEEKPVEGKPKAPEEDEKEEEWSIRTAPWALEEYPAPEPSVDWTHVAALLQQAKHLLSPAETPAETPTPETTPETPTPETPTPEETTPETPTPAEAPIDWEHATELLREARVLALQEKVASLQAEKASLETALEAEKAKAAQEEMEKAKAALAVLAAKKEKEVAEAEATFTESFEQAAAQEKAAEVARVLETYRTEVKKQQTAYNEKLDDFVYEREMAVKGHFLAEEEKLNERWAQRLAREVANVTAEAQEEKEKKEAELAALQGRVEALLEEMKAQEGVLRRAIRVQEYQQLLVTIQSRLLRQENVLPQLAQLVRATRRCEA